MARRIPMRGPAIIWLSFIGRSGGSSKKLGSLGMPSQEAAKGDCCARAVCKMACANISEPASSRMPDEIFN